LSCDAASYFVSFLFFSLLFLFFTLTFIPGLFATDSHDFVTEMRARNARFVQKISIKELVGSREYSKFNIFLDQYETSNENKKQLKSTWVHLILNLTTKVELDPFTSIFEDLQQKLTGIIYDIENVGLRAVWKQCEPFEEGPFNRIMNSLQTTMNDHQYVKNVLENTYQNYFIYDFLWGKDDLCTRIYRSSYKTLERLSYPLQQHIEETTFRFIEEVRKLEPYKLDPEMLPDSTIDSVKKGFKFQRIQKNWFYKISDEQFNKTLDLMVESYLNYKKGDTKGKIVIKSKIDTFSALKYFQSEGGIHKKKSKPDDIAEPRWDTENVANLRSLYPRYKAEMTKVVENKRAQIIASHSHKEEKEKGSDVDKPLTSANRMDPGFTRMVYDKLRCLRTESRWEKLETILQEYVIEYIDMYEKFKDGNAKAKGYLKKLYKQLFKLMDTSRHAKGSHKLIYFNFAAHKEKEKEIED
jgi:hypothetical protein